LADVSFCLFGPDSLVTFAGAGSGGLWGEAASEDKHAEQPMRFDARSLLAGCVIAVGLGATVFSSHWTRQSQANTTAIAETPPGQPTPNAGREEDPNAADEALKPDSLWEIWRPVVDF
jgi:hypothetical protein